MRVLVAGGGTAGHIEPAMNLADELVRRNPSTTVVALGTARGLEVDLVPKRGYELALIPPVPLPRRPGVDVLTLPWRLSGAVRDARRVMTHLQADVVVGFGGYVALPAYLAARGRVPIVVHEANARAGLANRVGARLAAAVAETVSGSLPRAVTTGIPLRPAIARLDRAAARHAAREHFGLPQHAPVLLVFGGSQGAARLNGALREALPRLDGIVVLHAHGARNSAAAPPSEQYIPLPYIDRMDLAYAAADLALCRSGAMTVAEVSAVGLPAYYVPLPIGNGEQVDNARPLVACGAARMIADGDMNADVIVDDLATLVADPVALHAMSRAARSVGRPDAAGLLADLVEKVVAT